MSTPTFREALDSDQYCASGSVPRIDYWLSLGLLEVEVPPVFLESGIFDRVEQWTQKSLEHVEKQSECDIDTAVSRSHSAQSWLRTSNEREDMGTEAGLATVAHGYSFDTGEVLASPALVTETDVSTRTSRSGDFTVVASASESTKLVQERGSPPDAVSSLARVGSAGESSNLEFSGTATEEDEIIQIKQRIGSGGCGNVVSATVNERFRMQEPFCGVAEVAVKLASATADNREMMSREFRIMCRLHECMQVPKPMCFVDAGDHVGFAMERLYGSDLHDLVSSHGSLSQNVAAVVMFDVLSHLDDMHKNGVAHMDIKMENIMCKVDRGPAIRSGDTLVVDFGNAIQDRDVIDAEKDPGLFSIGTPGYAAPEVLSLETYTPVVADIFSAGVVWAQLVTGRALFPCRTWSEYYDCLEVVEYTVPVGGLLRDKKLQELLRRMVSLLPEERPTAHEAWNTILLAFAEGRVIVEHG